MNKKETSWGKVATWYNDLLEGDDDSYQAKVILPNLLRILNLKEKDSVLDLACGQGFFTRAIKNMRIKSVVGADISDELITIAKKKDPKGKYEIVSAENLSVFKDKSFDLVLCVLALQNISDINKTFSEVSRITKDNGRFVFVINHPAFRIPKMSFWEWDEEKKIQYRRLDGYMSEQKNMIEMSPGSDKSIETISFHRPLQIFVKALSKNDLYIKRLEEWVSHKKSKPGPREKGEDMARKEFPMFMCIESVKVSS